MTTSPAGGWRDRLNDVQREAHRLALVSSEVLRRNSLRVRSWVAAELGPRARVARARAQTWLRTLGGDLRVIAGVEAATAETTAATGTASGQGAARLAAGAVGPLVDSVMRSAGLAGVALARGAAWVLDAARAAASASAVAAQERRARREGEAEVASDPTRVVAQAGDDVATILGRVDAAVGADLALLVPRGVASLRTPAAWLRIAGHTRRRGVSLSVIAARRDVRAYAAQSGFVAARTAGGLPAARSRLGLARLGETVWPSVFTLVAGLAVLVGGLGYLVPTAQIEVAPPSQPLEAELQVRINPLAPAIDVPSRTLPAAAVQRTVRAVVSVPASGSVRVGDRPAIVRLEFRNAGDRPLDLPAGTVVRDPARFAFATSEGARVEPGQSAFADAIALRPGTVGNMAPGSLRVLDDAPPALSVSNPAPSHGGSDRLASGVSQADVDRVHRMAEDVLTRVAVRQLNEEFVGGLVLTDGASIAVLSQQAYQQLDEPSEVFVAEYVARASLQVVLPETARVFAERYAATQIPPGRQQVAGAASAVMDDAGSEGGRTFARMRVSSATATRIDDAALAAEVAGASPTDARKLLRERLQLTSDPVVRINGWLPWPWLPSRSERIAVAVVRSEPGGAAPVSATPAVKAAP